MAILRHVCKIIICWTLVYGVTDCVVLTTKDGQDTKDVKFGQNVTLVWELYGPNTDSYQCDNVTAHETYNLTFLYSGKDNTERILIYTTYCSNRKKKTNTSDDYEKRIRVERLSLTQNGYNIYAVDGRDIGYHVCEYTSASTTLQTSIYINVTDAPPRPRVEAKTQPKLGGDVTLICRPGFDRTDDKKFPLKFTWYKDGQRVDNASGEHVRIDDVTSEHDGVKYTCFIQENNASLMYGPSDPYVIRLTNSNEARRTVISQTTAISSHGENAGVSLDDNERLMVGIIPPVLCIIVCLTVVVGTLLCRNKTRKKDNYLKYLKSAGVAMGTNTTATLAAGAVGINGCQNGAEGGRPQTLNTLGRNIYESVAIDDILDPDEMTEYKQRRCQHMATHSVASYDDIDDLCSPNAPAHDEGKYDATAVPGKSQNWTKPGFSKAWIASSARKVKQRLSWNQMKQRAVPVPPVKVTRGLNTTVMPRADELASGDGPERVSHSYDAVADCAPDSLPRKPRGGPRYSLQREIGGNRPGQLTFKYNYDEVMDAYVSEKCENEANELKLSSENLVLDNAFYQDAETDTYSKVKKPKKKHKPKLYTPQKGNMEHVKSRDHHAKTCTLAENLIIDNSSYEQCEHTGQYV